MMGIIFYHGAKENAVFYSKFNVLEFLKWRKNKSLSWRPKHKLIEVSWLSYTY